MAHATQPNVAAPLGEMNTTPLIDVLLVLLVMLILTIPVATHSVEIDLPQCGPECEIPLLKPDRNRLTLDASDRWLWNSAEVTRAELAAALAASHSLPIKPELQFAPDAGASYEAAVQTLATIKASGVTKFGFVGDDRFRAFGN